MTKVTKALAMEKDPYEICEVKVQKPDPRAFLEAVVMNVELSLHVRMRAAIELMPYTYPKLAVTAVVTERDFATLLDQRIARMERMEQQKVIEAKASKTIEPPPQIEARPQIETKPMAVHTNDRRFRRI